MIHPNTILSLLPKCKTLIQFKTLHALILTIPTTINTKIIPLSKLIDFCVDSHFDEYFNYAYSLFRQIHSPNVYIFNSMIKGYAKSNNPTMSLHLYKQMLQNGYSPDHFTFPFVLKACSFIYDEVSGKCVHSCILKSGFEANVYVATGLLNMYVECKNMENGLKVFDKIPKWNVVAWTSLINGYVSNDRPREALEVFKEMGRWGVEANEVTMVNALIACARCRDVDTGRWVHERICKAGYDPFVFAFDSNVILATAIVEMYAKCGWLNVARELFNKMPERNVVAWNCMINAYNQYERYNEALGLFFDMLADGFCPDKATFLCVLSVCARRCVLALGETIHAYLLKTNIATDIALATALLDMYAKNGELGSAQKIFNNSLEKKDVVMWTSMINALAIHGHGNEALSLFQIMQEDSSLVPDHITYIGVLFACSHVGLVEEAQKQFNLMTKRYGIVPEKEHYSCMVDLLSRAGHFREVEKLMETMSIRPNIAIWGALLNGCQIHENISVASQVKVRLAELEPVQSGIYALLSNMYANAGKWEEVNRTRKMMKHKRIAKTLGHSSVEMKLLTL